MKHSALVRKERLDAPQIAVRIAAIVLRLHSIVVSHDPGADDLAAVGDEEAAGKAGLAAVIVNALVPFHGSLSSGLATSRSLHYGRTLSSSTTTSAFVPGRRLTVSQRLPAAAALATAELT